MTLCALCRRDIFYHTETECEIHLKKLSQKINASETLKGFFSHNEDKVE